MSTHDLLNFVRTVGSVAVCLVVYQAQLPIRGPWNRLRENQLFWVLVKGRAWFGP